MELKNKKVTVVGLARSGEAVARLLSEKGARVSVSDCLENQKLCQALTALKSSSRIEKAELGRHTRNLIDGQDLVVLSPGVRLDAQPVVWARQNKIPVVSEIEAAYWFSPSPVIAITGTNGKTTVTTLIGRILRAAGKKCVVCGNIGTPFSAEVNKLTSAHIVVLEVSSFQLETIDKFRPAVAVVLNLTPDHLDRYKNIEQYAQVKARIFLNQTARDWAILNSDDPYKEYFAARAQSKIKYFSKGVEGAVIFPGFNANYAASIIASSLFSVDQQVSLGVCRRFKGIEHRLEQAGQIKGVTFINDSKATNVDSTIWALDNLKQPIVLIAGGRDKGSNFALIRPRLKNNVRAMVVFGEAREKIRDAFSDLLPIETAGDLEDAVKKALTQANKGDCVLLSPMCASFDMFDDYTHRGRVFKQIVNNLKPEGG